MLVLDGAGLLYTLLFIGQCCFYGLAALAAIQPSLSRIKPVKLAYYFVFMNYCAILGFFRFLKGNQSAAWEKSRRATA
jgi:hypothetical protein